VVSLFKNDWLPFVCGTDVSIEISCTKIAVRTRGDGHWKKYTYQDSEFTVTLSGLLVFDDENWTGWDMLDNQFNFNHVLARCSFSDEDGNVRTIQGYVMIETSTFSWSAGQLVKDDFQLQGNGKLDMFDGLEPCPTVITSITVDGQENADGIVHISYVYTGEAYQVKYRVDNRGDYIYALADLTIDIPGLTVNSHTVEIIPVCINGYEGTGLSQDFVVTQAMTCSSATTGMVIDTPDGSKYSNLSAGVTTSIGGSADFIRPTITGSATTYLYAFDGGAYVEMPISAPIPISGLSVGHHDIGIIPQCVFDGNKKVQGTGMAFSFDLNVQPSQSKVNYSYTNLPPNNSLNIYVNGVLTVALSNANGSNYIIVPNGASVKTVLASSAPIASRVGTLTVNNNTTGAQLANMHGVSPFTKQYSFTANGDEFTIIGVVSA